MQWLSRRDSARPPPKSHVSFFWKKRNNPKNNICISSTESPPVHCRWKRCSRGRWHLSVAPSNLPTFFFLNLFNYLIYYIYLFFFGGGCFRRCLVPPWRHAVRQCGWILGCRHGQLPREIAAQRVLDHHHWRVWRSHVWSHRNVRTSTAHDVVCLFVYVNNS